MTRLQQRLLRASTEFGILIELDFCLTLTTGHELTALARLHEFGSPSGMLIFSSYEDIRSSAQELVQAGFGYSVIDEPLDDETFDLER